MKNPAPVKNSLPKTRLIHLVLLQLIQQNKSIPAPKLWRLIDKIPDTIKTGFDLELSLPNYREILRQLQDAGYILLDYIANFNEITLTKTGKLYLDQSQQLFSSLFQSGGSKTSNPKSKVKDVFSIREFEDHATHIISGKIHYLLENPHEETQCIKQMVKEISELLPDFNDELK